jgi:hypothetical protein
MKNVPGMRPLFMITLSHWSHGVTSRSSQRGHERLDVVSCDPMVADARSQDGYVPGDVCREDPGFA